MHRRYVEASRKRRLCTKEKQNNKDKDNTVKNRNMKRKIQTIISASAASVLALSVLAQDTPTPKADGLNYAHGGMPTARRAARLNDSAKASDVIGMTVKNNQDEKLGKVEDLAVDVESGRIVQVILSTGGFKI